MMLSQTAEYALRAMACLASADGELTSTPVLARRTRVPPNYLAKVLQLLSQADLIAGRRGVGGGYRLTREPTDITMYDVVCAISAVPELHECPVATEQGRDLCPLHRRVNEMRAMLVREMRRTTLSELLDANGNSPLCPGEVTVSADRDGAVRSGA